MRIGELAHQTGTNTKAIRYYEDIGHLPEPVRDHNDYRDYSGGPSTGSSASETPRPSD